MTTERVPMTKEQYEKLKGDVDRLEQDMVEITKLLQVLTSLEAP